MPFGWEPRARLSAPQPARRRLSLGLVVVEAAQRSGSLITARLAGEMGRWSSPCPARRSIRAAAGTNGLLKDGAILVTEAARRSCRSRRLPAAFAAAAACEEPPAFRPPPPARRAGRLIEALGPTPVGIDELIRHTGLHPAQVFMILLELDLAGGWSATPAARSPWFRESLET